MDKHKGLLGASAFAVKSVLCILLVLTTFIFIYFGFIDKTDGIEKESIQFVDGWALDESDNNFTLIAKLPSEISDNQYLFFVTRKDTLVFINNVLRKDFIESRDINIPGGSVKYFYMMTPLNGNDSGAEVRVSLLSKDTADHDIGEAFISTRYGAYSYLLHKEGLSFFLAALVLVFSLVVFIVSIVLRFVYKLNIYMMYGALGIFVIAAWIITGSFLFPFIVGANHVNGILNYMLSLTITLPLSVYLNLLQGGRYKKSMSFIMIASSANLVIWLTLHFTGLVPLFSVRNVLNIISGFFAVFGMGILIMDAIRGNARKYRYTLIGMLGFLVCCLLVLTVLLFWGPASDTALPMVDGLAFLLVFVVIQQVDDLRKINMEKQHAIDISEAKTRFLASMSHEIRTPINAILGMNEMIQRENHDEVIGEYSRSIKTSGKMLLMLVNDVLDFSKIEAGKLEINERRFFMSGMLHDVISLVKERADEKGLELKAEVNGEVPDEVISDEFRIRQILVNLINNAVKYTEKGTVTLKVGGCYTDNDSFELKLLVKDTGKGIRKEEQDTLFDAFSRADVKSNVNIEGTGLGLAIVKSIVDSMKGNIWVDSEYGKGSEFWVSLPVKYSGKSILKEDFLNLRSDKEMETDQESFTAPDAKILAVDDNQSNLTIVKLFLKRTGIVPDLCSSGNRAIEMCRETKYDLILLDHMMPQPDGIEVLHAIRKDAASKNRDTKVIVLTANAVAGSRQMYLDEGFDDYLTKPLDAKVLEQTVKQMLPKDIVIETGKAAPEPLAEKEISIKSRLSAIEGLDYKTALGYCGGDEEFLKEIISDVAAEGPKRSERMRKNLQDKDMDAYRIEAHSVKSTMATIGLKSLSERAKKHEFAAKENNLEFISGDAEDFISEYIKVCEQLVL